MKKVLIITGPGGAGKTTIAELIAKNYGYTLLDGDHEDTEFFPDGNQWLPENADSLRKAHNKIVNKTKDLVEKGNDVVVDYIIFGLYLEFFEKFRKAFGEDLQIVVLFPDPSEIITRDREREIWTTGEERIKTVYREFEQIQNEVGKENYIDTSGQTPKETFKKYFNMNPQNFDNVEIKKSNIGQFNDGLGVFALKDFKKGEVVIKYHLTTLSEEEYKELPSEEKHFTHKRKGIIYYYPDPERHVNRHTEPNVYPDFEQGADIALRNIKKGEELSIQEDFKEDF